MYFVALRNVYTSPLGTTPQRYIKDVGEEALLHTEHEV
jgi:hypothetical protein